MGFWRQPQAVWWRKAIFQVHLWAGLILGLYLALMGVTGSILVFKDEIQKVLYPQFVKERAIGNVPIATPDEVFMAGQKAFPKYRISIMYAPGVEIGNWVLVGAGQGTQRYIFVDRAGNYMGSLDLRKQWLLYVALLHENLLLGRTGRVVNGIGGGALLLIALSGLVVWWSGAARWTRALGIKFGSGWRRVNFDLHSAVGFWTLLLLSVWGVTAVYFAWPKQFQSVVAVISRPMNTVQDIDITPPEMPTPRVSLAALEGNARSYAHASGKVAGIIFPFKPSDTLTVMISRGELKEETWDYVNLNPFTGEAMGVWHRGASYSLGDRIINLLGPIHFGTDWGLFVKIVWAVAGLALPVLFLTGALMYWNRSFRKKWSELSGKIGTSQIHQSEAVPNIEA